MVRGALFFFTNEYMHLSRDLDIASKFRHHIDEFRERPYSCYYIVPLQLITTQDIISCFRVNLKARVLTTDVLIKVLKRPRPWNAEANYWQVQIKRYTYRRFRIAKAVLRPSFQ